MREFKNPDEKFIDSERKRFAQTCDRILKFLGPRPLNPQGALSASLFDAVFIAFAKSESVPKDVASRYSKLKSSKEFNDLTSRGTTDAGTVKARLEMAEKALFG